MAAASTTAVASRAGMGAVRPTRALRPSRMRPLAAIVALLLASSLWALHPLSARTPAPQAAAGAAHAVPAHAIAQALAPLASADIGAQDRAYQVHAARGALTTSGAGIHSVFTAGGAQLRTREGTLVLSTASAGREGARSGGPARATLTSAGNRVDYRAGALGESYRNGPYGLEQSFDLRSRPHGGRGPLVLRMSTAGTLTPRLRGSRVVFQSAHGATALRYGQLAVTDASGRRLSAHMRVDGSAVQLVIDDSHARYPLRIDPFIQTAELSDGSEENGNFGGAVAISRDGNTALVGNPGGVTGGTPSSSAVWVFAKSGSTWTLQAKLESSESTLSGGAVCERFFGWSLALSSDGDTAVVGNPCGAETNGQAFVFTRTGTTWAQQGPQLSPIGEVAVQSGVRHLGGQFGSSVAVSADGNTALVGGQADNGNEGAVWVFTRSGSIWTQQGEKLTAGSGAELGASVALSGNGDLALLGGPHESDGEGAAWVFTRSAGVWSQQAGPLTGAGEVHEGDAVAFGTGVALSKKGTTALIGGPGDDDSAGAAWVFTRSGETWTQQGEKLTAGTEPAEGGFGRSVALSSKGSTALVGIGEAQVLGEGGAWAFRRAGDRWRRLGPRLTPTPEGEETIGNFGFAVALSGKGRTAVIGGPTSSPHAHGQRPGRAWVFERARR